MPFSAPCILDIEASGFGAGSYPIEVGYALPDGRARSSLIRPLAHWTHWDDAAQRLHRIDRSLLLRRGRTPHAVACALNVQLAGLTVYCDGWAHDYGWLATLFEAAGLTPRFKLDTVNSLLDEQQLACLDAARRETLAELSGVRHRAGPDARVLQRALMRVAGAALQV